MTESARSKQTPVRVPHKPYGEWLDREAAKAKSKEPERRNGRGTQINKAIRVAYQTAHGLLVEEYDTDKTPF